MSVDDEKRELDAAVRKVLDSKSPKKLVVAGPGTGKTTLFKELLAAARGALDQRLVLTFINNLRDDLDRSLGELARVQTLHGYCQQLLHRHRDLRGGLTENFVCYPTLDGGRHGLVPIIKQDWEILNRSEPPRFVTGMRDMSCGREEEQFYVGRSDFYDAVDFDDSVYRIVTRLREQPDLVPPYELVLIDEFQDFNKLEAALIDLLAARNSIVVAGDDDQALYSQLRGANWDHIRDHYRAGDFEVYHLPFCMRCPEPVVGAVNDVLARAAALGRLDGRIDKPYRFCEMVKGDDSRRYPQIDLVRTSVQTSVANYFGRYVERVIGAVPEEDFATAAENGEPAVLIIATDPYRRQIEEYLIALGALPVRTRVDRDARREGLLMLHANPASNLGWRIVLGFEPLEVLRDALARSAERAAPLAEMVTEALRRRIGAEAAAAAAEIGVGAEEAVADEPKDSVPSVRITSYEGAKGMAAQHVVLAGVHNGDLPRSAAEPRDLEICKFVVGMTRTKKKCTILTSRTFAGKPKELSEFVRWIDARRTSAIEVRAAFWK